MLKVGFVGWRGMVGSVLMQRMMEENDFADIEPQFFTTSQAGKPAPNVGKDSPTLKNAKSIADLTAMDVIVSCQGGDYTKEVFPKLRADGWNGHWVDAASTLRMNNEAVIVLDPVNMDVIKDGIDNDLAKRLVKTIKDSRMKVQASIQGETVRVNGAKRDLLQDAIALVKKSVTDFPLKFGNFRD